MLNLISGFPDCGRLYVCPDCVTATEVNVEWSCPCSDWDSVDKYQFNLTASDGEADFVHVDRCQSKLSTCPFVQSPSTFLLSSLSMPRYD